MKFQKILLKNLMKIIYQQMEFVLVFKMEFKYRKIQKEKIISIYSLKDVLIQGLFYLIKISQKLFLKKKIIMITKMII